MFAIVWAVLAILAAGASVVLAVDASTRRGTLRAVARAIDAEPGRPGIRDGDLAGRLAGHPAPAGVTVTAGFRHGTSLAVAATAGLLLTFGALVIGGGLTVPFATASLGLSAYIGLRYGNARRLHANRDRIRLRRWRTSADISLSAVRGVGLVPARPGNGRIWIALWCDPRAVSELPEPLTEFATVGAETGWLRLDPIEAVATEQLLRLRQFFADRWTIGDEDGSPQSASADLADLFRTAERLGFDGATGRYSVDDRVAGQVVHRMPSRLRWWRAKLTRSVARLPHTFEVRDGLLRTRWLIGKPDAAWKTAFYVTDRHGHRVGTLRPINVASRSFDLCGTDNRVLATLWPGDPRTTVVDTRGNILAVWDTRTTQLSSGADPSIRPLCLLSPIVARFAGTTAPARTPDSDTVPLTASPPPADRDTVVTRPGTRPDGSRPRD